MTEFTATVPVALQLYAFLDLYFPHQEERDWASRLEWLRIDGQGADFLTNPELQAQQEIQFALRHYVEDPMATNWYILWENSELLAVYKPAPLPMHRTTRHVVLTLTALVRQHPGLAQAQPLHRLDQETAGIVLFARDSQAAKKWQPKLKQLLVEKDYRAIVYGCPEWQSHRLQTRLTTRPDSAIRCQVYVAGLDQPGKLSTTEFKVIRRGNGYTEIECRLLTGRKHQIRAHLAHLGHPLVGDKIYAHDGQFYLRRLKQQLTPEDWHLLKTSHHLLVAHRVQLNLAEGLSQIIECHDRPEQWQSFAFSGS